MGDSNRAEQIFRQGAKMEPKMAAYRPWFVRRKYTGWGWRPMTWQGWLVTAFIVIAIAGSVYVLELAR